MDLKPVRSSSNHHDALRNACGVDEAARDNGLLLLAPLGCFETALISLSIADKPKPGVKSFPCLLHLLHLHYSLTTSDNTGLKETAPSSALQLRRLEPFKQPEALVSKPHLVQESAI